MTIARTIGRIGGVFATATAVTAFVGVAQAGASEPRTSEADRALTLRSEALNERYGLGLQAAVSPGMTDAAHQALRLRSEALNERYGPGPQTAANRALRLRSEALNERYSLGSRGAATVASHPTSSTRGFAWGAFGIGVFTTVGLALLTGGIVVRRRLAWLRGLAPRYRTT